MEWIDSFRQWIFDELARSKTGPEWVWYVTNALFIAALLFVLWLFWDDIKNKLNEKINKICMRWSK